MGSFQLFTRLTFWPVAAVTTVPVKSRLWARTMASSGLERMGDPPFDLNWPATRNGSLRKHRNLDLRSQFLEFDPTRPLVAEAPVTPAAL